MKNKYIIRFSSLKDGLHNFSYEVGNEFFEHIEYSEVREADLIVDISLDKKSTMMILDFDIKGKVKVMCDRCTDDFLLDIEAQEELIYRFGDEELGDEKVIVIYPNEIEIDVTHSIYEFLSLAVPSKKIHNEGGCNKNMLEQMSSYMLTEEDKNSEIDKTNSTEEIDPRWSALNKLKNK